MKDILGGIGLFLGYMALRIAGAAWWLLKVFLGFCVVIGAATQILKQFTLIHYEQLGWSEAFLKGVWDLGSDVIDNWMAFAVLLMFFWVISIKRTVSDLSSNITQTKIGVVATMNYLSIDVQTEGMKQLQDEGLLKMLKTSLGMQVWGTILGMKKELTDDTLTAKAVRHGNVVSLLSDLDDYLKSEPSQARGERR